MFPVLGLGSAGRGGPRPRVVAGPASPGGAVSLRPGRGLALPGLAGGASLGRLAGGGGPWPGLSVRSHQAGGGAGSVLT